MDHRRQKLQALADKLVEQYKHGIMSQEEEVKFLRNLTKPAALTLKDSEEKVLLATCYAYLLNSKTVKVFDTKVVKDVLIFIVDAVYSLRDEKNLAEQYYRLLESLNKRNTFKMCLLLKDERSIKTVSCSILNECIRAVTSTNSATVHEVIKDILNNFLIGIKPLQLYHLDVVLCILTDRYTNVAHCELVVSLLKHTKNGLEMQLHIFLHKLLAGDPSLKEEDMSVSNDGFKIIELLHSMYPICLLPVMGHFIHCLHQERKDQYEAVTLLATLYIKDASLIKHEELWHRFLITLQSSDPKMRHLGVTFFKRCIKRQPSLCKMLFEVLEDCSYDSIPKVQELWLEALSRLLQSAFVILEEEPKYLNSLSVMLKDSMISVRLKALEALADIYEAHTEAIVPNPPALANVVNLIMNHHNCPDASVEERKLVETLLKKKLIVGNDHKIAREPLMKLWVSFDEDAARVFHDICTSSYEVTEAIRYLTYLPHDLNDTELLRQLRVKIYHISSQLRADQKHIESFVKEVFSNSEARKCMVQFIGKEASCEESKRSLLKMLKQTEVSCSIIYLLEKLCCTISNADILSDIISKLSEMLIKRVPSLDTTLDTVEIYLKLVYELFTEQPSLFQNNDIWNKLAVFFEEPDFSKHSVQMYRILSLATSFKPRGQNIVPINLQPLSETVINSFLSGKPGQVKHVTRFLAASNNNKKECCWSLAKRILHFIRIDGRVEAIVAAGHLAAHYSADVQQADRFLDKLILEYAMKAPQIPSAYLNVRDWCEKDQLPATSLRLVEACKALGRWMHACADQQQTAIAFHKLNSYVTGNFKGSCYLGVVEKAWLRYSAAAAILKMCQREALWLAIKPRHFFDLGKLVNDERHEVRKMFLKKLSCKLNSCDGLSTAFFGLFALIKPGCDPETRAWICRLLDKAVRERRKSIVYSIAIDQYFQNFDELCFNQPKRFVEYCLSAALALLAYHHPHTYPPSERVLSQISCGLYFLLQAIITDKNGPPYRSLSYYKNVFTSIKKVEMLENKNNPQRNQKLRTAADIGLLLLTQFSIPKKCTVKPTSSDMLPAFFRPLTPHTYTYTPLKSIKKIEIFIKKLRTEMEGKKHKTKIASTTRGKRKASWQEDHVSEEDGCSSTEESSDESPPRKSSRV